MRPHVIAYDLGTGGCKASLYDANGGCVSESFNSYPTSYTGQRFHEQMPLDWWRAIREATGELLSRQDQKVVDSIKGLGISGHSLAMVPLDREGQLLLDSIPIWSDSRPDPEDMDVLFKKISQAEWYSLTGNGFPPQLYTVFKICWLRRTRPDIFSETKTILGSKDYINFLLTGVIATDCSYASGSGVYDLVRREYSQQLVEAINLPLQLFPEIHSSDSILGPVLPEIARELGLPADVQVVCGGVDNSCMALGAACFRDGDIYNSLGSSSWIAVSSGEPLIDREKKPFVFDHVVSGQYVSATSIFSAGSSYRWFQENFCQDLAGEEIFQKLDEEAVSVPPGAENLIFNPNLAGGSPIDGSPFATGGFLGMNLGHRRAHCTRAVMEGIGFGLRVALEALRSMTAVNQEMLIVGGGGKSKVWRQILADIYGVSVVKSAIDQQAAALGAAALALKGLRIQNDYSFIDSCHANTEVTEVDPENKVVYDHIYPLYQEANQFLIHLGEKFEEM